VNGRAQIRPGRDGPIGGQGQRWADGIQRAIGGKLPAANLLAAGHVPDLKGFIAAEPSLGFREVRLLEAGRQLAVRRKSEDRLAQTAKFLAGSQVPDPDLPVLA
jgi:hypothetical protein